MQTLQELWLPLGAQEVECSASYRGGPPEEKLEVFNSCADSHTNKFSSYHICSQGGLQSRLPIEAPFSSLLFKCWPWSRRFPCYSLLTTWNYRLVCGTRYHQESCAERIECLSPPFLMSGGVSQDHRGSLKAGKAPRPGNTALFLPVSLSNLRMSFSYL